MSHPVLDWTVFWGPDIGQDIINVIDVIILYALCMCFLDIVVLVKSYYASWIALDDDFLWIHWVLIDLSILVLGVLIDPCICYVSQC